MTESVAPAPYVARFGDDVVVDPEALKAALQNMLHPIALEDVSHTVVGGRKVDGTVEVDIYYSDFRNKMCVIKADIAEEKLTPVLSEADKESIRLKVREMGGGALIDEYIQMFIVRDRDPSYGRHWSQEARLQSKYMAEELSKRLIDANVIGSVEDCVLFKKRDLKQRYVFWYPASF